VLGKQTASAAADATTEVAGTAAEGAKQVASEAAQQVTEVAKTASDQARQLAEKAQSDLRQQAAAQTGRAAGGLRDVSHQVRALTEGRTDEAGPAADIARQVADKIGEAAGWLEEKGFDGAVQDVRDLARRRPGTFLLGAVAAGFAVGRLGRGLQATTSNGSSPTAALPPAGATGGPAGLYGVEAPAGFAPPAAGPTAVPPVPPVVPGDPSFAPPPGGTL